jgi:hypothetical protein
MSGLAAELNAGLIIDGTKIGWWKDRVLAWERGERVAPVTMDIAWTRRCNAACDFCAAKTQASASPSLDIPRDTAFEFLADAAEIGVRGISLISDGESTLVDYYAESIEEMARLGIGWASGPTASPSTAKSSSASCRTSPISGSTSPPARRSATPRSWG